MKILTVSYSDSSGGAAKAAYRLHRALVNEGIESWMLVQKKERDDWCVIGPDSNLNRFVNIIRPAIEQLPVKWYKNRKPTIFSPSLRGNGIVLKMLKKVRPDIVHLHWVNGGMIKIEDLTKIDRPIVWTLHDNWVFTGGCHIIYTCQKYKQRCGACPVLASTHEYDLSRWVWNRKYKVYNSIKNLTIVTPSRWLTDIAGKSSLLKNKKKITIPNGIDTQLFKPIGKSEARKLWNFPSDKKLILFGAVSATDDENKGYKELIQALNRLTEKNVELVIFGSSEPQTPLPFKFKTRFLGYLHDDVSLASLYSAVDVTVVPSLQEAFGQVAAESMSCETPVVAFKTSGLQDIIDDKQNAYLAEAYDTKDLAYGIKWVLNTPDYDLLCQNAREKIVKEFDSESVARKYIALYEEILNGY